MILNAKNHNKLIGLKIGDKNISHKNIIHNQFKFSYEI